jgi:hypothetical protein
MENTVTASARKLSTATPELVEWDDEFLVRRGNYLTTITPDLAKQLLDRNYNNRRPKIRAIGQYAKDMKAGRWDPDASDLKFARTGELVDGQNRLMACVQADTPFPTLVRTGVRLEAKNHVDTGVKRTVSDMLKMKDIKYPTATGAAVALWDRYVWRITTYGGKRTLGQSHPDRLPSAMTHDEIERFLEAHPGLIEYGTEAEHLRKIMPAIPPSVTVCWSGMCSEIDRPLLEDTLGRLLNAEFGDRGDPLQALVGYAAMARGIVGYGNNGRRGRVTQESHMIAMVRVWNALRHGDKIENRIIVKVNSKLILPE